MLSLTIPGLLLPPPPTAFNIEQHHNSNCSYMGKKMHLVVADILSCL